jgi:NAD(P)-dependent dehydrogenase (short-subunit alcohol dehydrogenase family)
VKDKAFLVVGGSSGAGFSVTQKLCAEAALYLLSPCSFWMTGQVLHVDGGISSVRLFES